MQQQQQQQRPATFYETLRVPPTATRAQIKQSYLSLVRMFDGRNGGGGGEGGGRRSREFNDVARAYMVLSDDRTRERYDRQLEREEAQRRMRWKMMEEERSWEEERMSAMRMGAMPPGMMGSGGGRHDGRSGRDDETPDDGG